MEERQLIRLEAALLSAASKDDLTNALQPIVSLLTELERKVIDIQSKVAAQDRKLEEMKRQMQSPWRT